MNSRSLLAASAAVAACLACLRASPPASSSAAAAATLPADLARYIRAMRTAGDSRAAMAAYARGCSINRKSLQLQEAYMVVMLRLGQPRTAAFPARALLAIKTDHAMAWAVVGYNEAKRKRLGKALEATFRAAGKLTDNPSVLHNAGQLLVWYENQAEPPTMADATNRAIEKAKATLAKKEFFTKARKTTQAQYDDRKNLRDQHQAKIDAVKGEAKEILATGKEIDRVIADLADEIKRCQENISDMRRDYRRLRDHPERDPTGTRRPLLNLKITDERLRVKTLEERLATTRARGQQVLGQLRRKLAEVKKLERNMVRELGKKPIRFRWDPPAVDGMVVPEAALRARTSTAPTPAGSGDQPAEARLKMAKLYLNNKMPEKAATILNEIIAKYPTSSAAAQAKAILAKPKSTK